MSIYSTLYITRKEAENMVRECRKKLSPLDDISMLSDKALDSELHKYVYENEDSGQFTDIVSFAHNYIIKD